MIDDDGTLLDLDDGATEVVDGRPRRRGTASVDLAKVVASPAGGRLVAGRAAAAEQSGHYITVRTPLGAAKIALGHASVFHDLWRCWTVKRADGVDDPGVSAGEVTAAGETDKARVRAALQALVRHRLVKAITQHVGYQGTRIRYYPTDFGVQTFALAEVLGAGSSVQVGRTSEAWRGRNLSEPSDLFQFAALLRGGAHPVQP